MIMELSESVIDAISEAIVKKMQEPAKWVNNIHDLPICSKCGNYAVFDHAIDDYYYSEYCPNCGARMENAKDYGVSKE